MTTWPDAPFTGEPWTQEPTGPGIGYMVRTSTSDRRGFDGFRWPLKGYVEPAFREDCALNGIYGILDGVGDWSELMPYRNPVFQVVAVARDECIQDPKGDSVRVPRGWVIYTGDVVGALKLMVPIMKQSPLFGATVNDRPAGDADVSFSSIESEDQSVVANGSLANARTTSWFKAAITTAGGTALAEGRQGLAVATHGGRAESTGTIGVAFSYSDQPFDLSGRHPPAVASSGESGLAIAGGVRAEASAGPGGAIILAEYHQTEGWLLFSSRVGENGIEANVSYALINGVPERAADWPMHERSAARTAFTLTKSSGINLDFWREMSPERMAGLEKAMSQAIRALIAADDRAQVSPRAA